MRTLQDMLNLSENNQHFSYSVSYAVAVSLKTPPLRNREITDSDEALVSHVLYDYLSKLGAVWFETLDGKLMFCIAMPADVNQISISSITGALEDAKSDIMSRFLLATDASISNVHNLSDSIDDAYHEALETLDYIIICSSGRPVSYCEYIENTKSYGYYYSVDKEKQLITLIKIGARDDAIKLVDDIINENFLYNCMPVSLFSCFKYDIAGTVIKAIRDIFKSLSGNVIKEVNPLEKLAKCVSANEMKTVVAEILDEIYTYSQGSARSNLTVSVIDYVEKNYMNPNLSVSEICSHLGVHISHLSTSFKKQIGVGLSEYIRQVRVDKSKVLLKATNQSIFEIAKSVGYLCPHTFTRVFKSGEGITPSKYRERY